ncbi:Crocetin glucosyltransferase, chloroplastic [Vitis vinifera]|uniref:Glycosyltransferase n=1 Tax=Vitis vinifera TaxID=29760 RepID=A0A438D6T9_VITVI|nr:Crocetin glucosyltransferase, chloroplastic [Vitis vinifera]
MQPQILLVTYPAQGHINPSLQLAKLLIRAGAHVTFVTSSSAGTRMSKSPTLDGLEFVTFSDGYDHGFDHGVGLQNFMSELERLGSPALTELIMARANEGRPFTCLLYGMLIPWVAEVARSLHLPSALVWSQPAAVFDIYYYYFNGYGELIGKRAMKQLEQLNRESNPRVLVNSFDALESEALRAINKFKLMGIGPLLPSAFLDGKDPSDTSFGGDLFRGSKDYIQWLNSNAESSVIYVSFGSLSVLSKQQSEEIARGLLDSGRPFLWVIRAKENEEEEKEDKLSCVEELEQLGMIVPWCSQVEVLSHPSLGCFVSHCGWNSTLESLACGVPVVAFPQWTDQTTNAKLIEDVWKTGLRVMVNQEGIVKRGEIKKCLELVMGGGERGQEVRSNAKKWKDLAREAVKDGGSSDKNLKNFVDEIIQGH